MDGGPMEWSGERRFKNDSKRLCEREGYGNHLSMPRRLAPQPLAAKVGNRIRDLREQQGLSLASLAEASGLSKGHMSSVERGLVMMTLGTVMAMARALKVPAPVLLMFDEEEQISGLIEHVRVVEGNDIRRTAEVLRKAAFGSKAKKAPAPKPIKKRTRKKS